MSTPFDTLIESPPNFERIGREIRAFDSIDSTNTYVLDRGGDGLVVVADRQTLGRGRQGRSWHSAPGLGLWFTVALEGEFEGLTFAAALAVRDAVAPRAALRVKWPNDLLANGRKVCGILVERRGNMNALGIGLNVSHREDDFPEDLREKASSLEREFGPPWDRTELLSRVLTELDKRVMLIIQGRGDSIRSEWAGACALEGKRIRCGDREGRVLRLNEHGAIELDTIDGIEKLYSGDIELLEED